MLSKVLCTPLALVSILLLSITLAGCFFEWTSAIICILLTLYILFAAKERGSIKVLKSWTLAAVAAIVIMHGLARFWGVDRGMSLIGMVKFLPLPLFLLAISQIEPPQRKRLMQLVPWIGAAMVLVSLALIVIPGCKSFFYVNDRLSGFFQYPNVFGLFLLLGVILLLTGDKPAKKDFPLLAILFLGIVLSGSRTVFIMLLVTVSIAGFIHPQKRVRWGLLGMAGALLVTTGIYAAITGNLSSVGRYLTISLSTSTFVGRLLYYKDALPVILKHPLGLGYMGYYCLQGSFQTGVYSLVSVHNEMLQILLDVGWLPAALCIVALIDRWRKSSFQSRLLVLAICLHAMVDFDLQFISIGFLLILALEQDNDARSEIKLGKAVWLSGICLSVVCIWLFATTGAYQLKQYDTAIRLYPDYTMAYVQKLPRAQTIQELDQLADKVLAGNDDVALAWFAKAKAAYAGGDIGHMITFEKEGLVRSRYTLEEYLAYFDMLYAGLLLYQEDGDEGSADYCKKCLHEIPEMLGQVLESTSPLAWRIDEKPELELPQAYRAALAALD